VESEVSEVRQALYRGDRATADALVAGGAALNVFDAAALDEAEHANKSELAALLRERGARLSGNQLPR
jgi:hypothetical protein